MNEHEASIVGAFVVKEKRDRYAYLLGDPKKRAHALGRLNHCRDLDPRWAQWLPSNADVAELLKREGCPSQVYVMSAAPEIDGQTLSLTEALQLVPRYGWGTIVSCIPGKLAYYYDEEGTRRALLKKVP